MSTMSLTPAPRSSNVYYLAASPSEPMRTPRLSASLVLRLRMLAFWWRLKLTAAETWDVLRRFSRPEMPEDTAVLEQRADLILAARPRTFGPARIIDLDAARVRLRA
jgi:hypothetical protein